MKKLFLFSAVMFAVNFSYAQWEPDVRLTNDPGTSWTSYNNAWNMATSGDTVHIVWYDDRGGHFQIFYLRSIDCGLTWEAETQLTNMMINDANEPSISVFGSTVHVFWYYDLNGNYEIYYKRSLDGGNTWEPNVRLTNSVGDSWELSSAVSGTMVHVLWYDDRNGNDEIYYKRSADAGTTWDADSRLTNDVGYSGFPCVAAMDSMVHVVWEEDRDGLAEIYYKRSTDSGFTWGLDTRLTYAEAGSWDPCIAIQDSIIHVVWWDERNSGNIEIYYKRSTDAGLNWEEDIRLTNAPGDGFYPTIVASGPFVHVTWWDTQPGNHEIYYRRSGDRGTTWEPETRLTNATGYSENSSVALTDSIVHVVWSDNRNGNAEIYYKRNPTGNPIVGLENPAITNFRQQVIIYPNPASASVHIILNSEPNQTSGNKVKMHHLTIRNILGEEVLSKQFVNNESDIDVSNLSIGIYFMGLQTDSEQPVSTKLIILK